MTPKAKVCEEQLRPLMSQIHAVCKEHGINYVACFELDERENEFMYNTSAYTSEGVGDKLRIAIAVLTQPIVKGINAIKACQSSGSHIGRA